MATRRVSSQTKIPLELLCSPDEARTRLQARVDKGLEFKQRQINVKQDLEALKKDYYKWNDFNVEMLKRLFTSEELAKEYSGWGGILIAGLYPLSLHEEVADAYKEIDGAIHRLESILERLELIPVSGLEKTSSRNIEDGMGSPNTKVFVVHGQNETAKTNLEIFLREIGLDPIVLHRQADEGLTIIEKFEKHSDVGYAFILLTPDEIAYLVSEEEKSDSDRKKELRARPNVIFEFGFFVGKLGRARVCCLYTGDVSLPSDVSGMIYKRYEKNVEEVAYSIIKDLKASGYRIA